MTGATMLLLLLSVSISVIVKQSPIIVDSPTIMHQEYYMYDSSTSPRVLGSSLGKSFISINYDVSKAISHLFGRGDVETLIMHEDVYNSVGVVENNKRLFCCDGHALEKKLCDNYNQLIVSNEILQQTVNMKSEFSGSNTTISLMMDVTKEGKYIVLLAICDSTTSNLQISGTAEIRNPYGYFPARQFGLIPFSFVLCLIYLLLSCYWILRCFSHSEQLMNIHVIIMGMFILCTVAIAVRCIDQYIFNRIGSYFYSFRYIDIFLDVLARTVVRAVLVLLSMGMGITTQTIGISYISLIIFSIIYFLFAFLDNTYQAFSPSYIPDLWNTIPSIILDAVLYFWIFLSIIDSMTILENKNQNRKLETFKIFRIFIITSIILSTCYNFYFEQFISYSLVQKYWKMEWFYSEGIWDLVYVALLIVIAMLWVPNERTAAYARHLQISADDKKSQEYELEDDPLQYADGEEEIKVLSLDPNFKYQMKPMKIGV